MIDTIYQLVLTLLSKDLQGYVTPVEYNRIAKQVQDEIFSGYFEDENRDKIRQNKGLTNRGYSHLAFNQRQRIAEFAKIDSITADVVGTVYNTFSYPTDLYMLEDNGLFTTDGGILLDEVQRNAIVTMRNTSVAPSATYPAFEMTEGGFLVSPISVEDVDVMYVRKPKDPNWTYTIVGNNELFNPANSDFQDFELHTSEFTNIVINILAYFGLTIREEEVTSAASALDAKQTQKDNG